MGRHFEAIAEKIIESVESYNISIETVAPLVKVYADMNLEKWQHFSGWNFIDGGKISKSIIHMKIFGVIPSIIPNLVV